MGLICIELTKEYYNTGKYYVFICLSIKRPWKEYLQAILRKFTFRWGCVRAPLTTDEIHKAVAGHKLVVAELQLFVFNI